MPRTIDPRVDIGHVHLKVSDLDRALGFYRDVLGFDVTQRYGDEAAFLSAGGYHHHLGLNTWESRGGSPPPQGTTGLYHVAIRYPDRATLGDALRRLIEAGVPISGATDHGVSEAIYLRDPDGNGIELYRDRPLEEWPRADDRDDARDQLRLPLPGRELPGAVVEETEVEERADEGGGDDPASEQSDQKAKRNRLRGPRRRSSQGHVSVMHCFSKSKRVALLYAARLHGRACGRRGRATARRART